VGALGEILEVLHDAAERARPARLTVVEWRHQPRAQAAFQRYMTRRLSPSRAALAVPTTGSAPPDEATWTTSLALDSATRFREDSAGVQEGIRYMVRDGDRWVSWDAAWGATTSTSHRGGAPTSPYAFLLDPSGVLGSFRLEPAGRIEVAGRPAHRARAFERSELDVSGAALLRIGAGADVVELAVDADHGALLRTEALLDGEPFHRLDVTEIAFAPNPPETFALVLPEGAEASRRPVAPAPTEPPRLAG
jgi:hypothetical protein